MPGTRKTEPRRPPAAWLRRARLIGMVHLPALPGSARARLPLGAIIRRAVAEARQLSRAGFDALIVENFGDAPFAADHVPPETIAAMSLVVDHVVRADVCFRYVLFHPRPRQRRLTLQRVARHRSTWRKHRRPRRPVLSTR